MNPEQINIHSVWLRINHWINLLAVVILVLSGWRIYNASPIFAFSFPKQITLGGWLGGALLTALMATVVWMLYDYHIIDSAGRSVLVWIGLVTVGIILGVGLSWSLIRARVVGQVEVD